jgi:hypothetical protein
VLINLVEQSSQVTSRSPQQVKVTVTYRETAQPVQGIEARLEMTLPDGSTYQADIPATDRDGISLVNIPAMNKIANGTILTYKVCLKTVTNPPICAESSYLIWNNP